MHAYTYICTLRRACMYVYICMRFICIKHNVDTPENQIINNNKKRILLKIEINQARITCLDVYNRIYVNTYVCT